MHIVYYVTNKHGVFSRGTRELMEDSSDLENISVVVEDIKSSFYR